MAVWKMFNFFAEQCRCSGLFALGCSDLDPIFELYDHHYLKPACEDLLDSSSHSLQLQNAQAASIVVQQSLYAICIPMTRNATP